MHPEKDWKNPDTGQLPVVRLKIARRSSHPWIFQKMTEKPANKPPNGSVVEIVDRDDQWVGRGFFNGHSRISLRVLTTNREEPVNDEFFISRIGLAVRLRREILQLDDITDAYRLVHSEGDNLSGLVVDRFGDRIVIEYFAAGMFRFNEIIHAAINRHFPDCQVYWFADERIQKQESFNCRPPEPPKPTVIKEHGLRFRVTPGSKHKTGFFLDQRDNRKRLSEYCEGKRVLDICTNSGGFAVYAKSLGKAKEVVGIDLDEDAVAAAKHNANLNNAQIRFIQADLFTWLRDILPSGQRYDVVVLDPSKQTRDRGSIEYALKRYFDMNQLAMQAVAPGGLFLTCSCTGLVREADFLDVLRRAAWRAGKVLQVLQITGAGPDHPFLAHADESRYLKAVYCLVQDRA